MVNYHLIRTHDYMLQNLYITTNQVVMSALCNCSNFFLHVFRFFLLEHTKMMCKSRFAHHFGVGLGLTLLLKGKITFTIV